ncbi:hypothetical protein [Lactococcus sp.]|uniref:hypothetical protein n=1 Tax=Lactococcus sp. TaxID=44273 RepID=UPI0035B39704
MNKEVLSEDSIKHIISRLIDNANEAVSDSKKNKGDTFYDGKKLAYYEMLDTLKNELFARGQDLKEFGLDKNLEKELL